MPSNLEQRPPQLQAKKPSSYTEPRNTVSARSIQQSVPLENNDLLRRVTQDFNVGGLAKSDDPTLRALGVKIEKAFKDPIEAIKQEFGLEREFF